MKAILTFLLIFTLCSAHSCSCWGPQDFVSIISDSSHTQDFIIMGKKIRDVEHGMEMEVIKSYRNQIEKEKIIVWGDTGWLCRIYTEPFTIGDTLILNLYQIGDSPYISGESSGDFVLSVCGRHYLHVKDKKVIGAIDNDEIVQTSSLDNFNDFLSDNADLVLDEPTIELNAFPNPFFENIVVCTNQKNTTIQIYDVTGKLLFQDEKKYFCFELNTSHLSLVPGLYILRIIGQKLEEKTIRIIKY